MSTTDTAPKRQTRDEMLAWVKRTLVEMPECRLEPEFITWGTELTRKMFEFLYERVRTERIPMHKGHMNFQPEDMMRDFIAQLDTAGSPVQLFPRTTASVNLRTRSDSFTSCTRTMSAPFCIQSATAARVPSRRSLAGKSNV